MTGVQTCALPISPASAEGSVDEKAPVLAAAFLERTMVARSTQKREHAGAPSALTQVLRRTACQRPHGVEAASGSAMGRDRHEPEALVDATLLEHKLQHAEVDRVVGLAEIKGDSPMRRSPPFTRRQHHSGRESLELGVFPSVLERRYVGRPEPPFEIGRAHV